VFAEVINRLVQPLLLGHGRQWDEHGGFCIEVDDRYLIGRQETIVGDEPMRGFDGLIELGRLWQVERLTLAVTPIGWLTLQPVHLDLAFRFS
jgi:hypothetical protein